MKMNHSHWWWQVPSYDQYREFYLSYLGAKFDVVATSSSSLPSCSVLSSLPSFSVLSPSWNQNPNVRTSSLYEIQQPSMRELPVPASHYTKSDSLRSELLMRASDACKFPTVQPKEHECLNSDINVFEKQLFKVSTK